VVGGLSYDVVSDNTVGNGDWPCNPDGFLKFC
jgi:hypothetical protein